VLQGQQAVDLNGNISLEALARTVDPHFDYTVTVENPGAKPLVFKESDLSEGRRNQFRTTSVERVAALLQRESDGAKLAHAQRLWRKEEPFLPGPDRDALELLAQVQVADSPISPENLQQHMDNCKVYVDRFGLLPEPYARAIKGLIQSDNPAAAAMGAQILASIRAISDGAAAVVSKPFDDETLLCANMLHGLILGGTALDDAFKLVKTSMAMAAGDLKKRLPSETSGEKERAKFYGNEVTAEVYGPGGVAEYRQMVDANFIINGGASARRGQIGRLLHGSGARAKPIWPHRPRCGASSATRRRRSMGQIRRKSSMASSAAWPRTSPSKRASLATWTISFWCPPRRRIGGLHRPGSIVGATAMQYAPWAKPVCPHRAR
jgi:hypothetical protein